MTMTNLENLENSGNLKIFENLKEKPEKLTENKNIWAMIIVFSQFTIKKTEFVNLDFLR